MRTREFPGLLFAEVGPLLSNIEEIRFDGDSQWAIAFDEKTIVMAACDEASGKLTFWVELTELPESADSETLQMLLCFNFLWQETGGARIALNQPGGTVMLVFDVVAEGLDVNSLAHVLENMVDHTGRWRQALRNAAADESASLELGRPAASIRV
ncbi:MAG: type III secretion system chaperone [Pirellulales bacterium]|nr:type III secretion system chaperone [Pirellulales bacterium]